MKHHIFAAFIALNLTGCITAHMWDTAPINESTISYQAIGNDKVHAFGIAQTDSAQLKSGSLIMMGERYWYALETQDSGIITPVLSAKLSKRYEIFDTKNQQALLSLPVHLSGEKHSAYFSSNFCLRYQLDEHSKDQEALLLTQLEFIANQENPLQYHRCLSAHGNIFTTPAQHTTQHVFEQYVPVSLYVQHIENKNNVDNLILNTLMTPIALAADAVIGVALVPAMIASLPDTK